MTHENARRAVVGARHNQRWTEREDRMLEWGWGHVGAGTLALRLGRSPVALRQRAMLRGLHVGQGSLTLRQVIERLGYHRTTILKICDHIGITPRRRPSTVGRRRGRTRAFSLEQVDEIEAELDRRGWPIVPFRQPPPSVWGVLGRPDACRCCGTVERDHCCRGLCARCYMREKRKARLRQYEPIRWKGAS